MKSAHYFFFEKEKKNEIKRDKTIHGGRDKKRKELKYEQRASEKKKKNKKHLETNGMSKRKNKNSRLNKTKLNKKKTTS